MNEEEKYNGFKWINVKQVKPTIFGKTAYVEEQHHINETSFLINKIRELAKRIDILNANLKIYENSNNKSSQQYENDYLPYEEDYR